MLTSFLVDTTELSSLYSKGFRIANWRFCRLQCQGLLIKGRLMSLRCLLLSARSDNSALKLLREEPP